MKAAELLERRLVLGADLLDERATVGEHAAGRRLADVRQEAGDRVQSAVILAHAATRDTAEQSDRVRVARVLQHGLDRALLDHAAGIEHAHALAHLRNHTEVVADEEHGRVKLALQVLDQIEHLRLDRRVEAGGRLVQDEQRRVLGERHRDHDPLLHAAGELMGVAVHHGACVGDLHLLERRLRALHRLLSLHAAHGEHLGDLPADADRRVQRRARVLVDHADVIRP